VNVSLILFVIALIVTILEIVSPRDLLKWAVLLVCIGLVLPAVT
jgi:hypothetical protein